MATEASFPQPATLTDKAPETFDAHFKTTAGDFTVHVTRAWAPLGADRFYNLVKHGFYHEAAFFRVVPGFVVQFGLHADPKIGANGPTPKLKHVAAPKINTPGLYA